MDNTKTSIEILFEKAEAYGKTTYELSKLKALETGTGVIITLVSKLSVILMLCLFILIFNIGVALYLGELLGKIYYGFFIVASFYLFLSIIMHFCLHRWIKKPLGNLIITQALQ